MKTFDLLLKFLFKLMLKLITQLLGILAPGPS